MKHRQPLSRRDFLRLSAFTAVGATIVACGPQSGPSGETPAGSAAAGDIHRCQHGCTEAPAASARRQHRCQHGSRSAPAGNDRSDRTTEHVQRSPHAGRAWSRAGDLPPVDQRLPKSPYVPPHAWLTTGNYGGAMNWTNSWGGNGVSTIVVESMYGHSPLRWLRDGLEIGPGLAESWESNDDTTEWTFKFREGLKWSDGEPWTAADIMFWWEDLANVDGASVTPPDEARSGTGTLAKFEAVDDYHLEADLRRACAADRRPHRDVGQQRDDRPDLACLRATTWSSSIPSTTRSTPTSRSSPRRATHASILSIR